MPPACKGEPGLGFSDQREKERVPQRWQTADGWVALCLGVPTASQDAMTEDLAGEALGVWLAA